MAAKQLPLHRLQNVPWHCPLSIVQRMRVPTKTAQKLLPPAAPDLEIVGV